MRPLFSTSRARPRVKLSDTAVLEDAEPGTPIATVFVAGSDSTQWTYALLDDADGQFALEGPVLTVAAPLAGHAAKPFPSIVIQANDGAKTVTGRAVLSVRRRLAPLPLPAGARVLGIGDSLIGYNNYAGPGLGILQPADAAAPSYAYGPIEQAFASDPRFDFDSWFDPTDPLGRNLQGANQGIFGDHLEWNQAGFGGGVLGRLRALARRQKAPDVAVLLAGTNTINSGDNGRADVGYLVARLDQCLQVLRDAGIWTILGTLYPRGDWPAGDARHLTLLAVNDWIRSQEGRDGLIGIWDGWSVLTGGGVQDATLFFTDKVHPNPVGSLKAGYALTSVIGAAISPGSVFDQNPAIANLHPASVANMSGTSGTRSGTAVTGSVATGFVVSGGAAGSSATVTCLKEVIAGALERQVLVIDPVATSGNVYDTVTVAFPVVSGPALPAAGDWVRMHLFVEIGDTTAIAATRLRFTARQSSTIRAGNYAMATFSSDFARPVPGNRAFWISTKPMQLPTGVLFDRLHAELQIYWSKSAAPGAVVKLSRPIVRTIADPRLAWGY